MQAMQPAQFSLQLGTAAAAWTEMHKIAALQFLPPKFSNAFSSNVIQICTNYNPDFYGNVI